MKTGVDSSNPHSAENPERALDATLPGAGPPADARGVHATAIGDQQLYVVAAAEENDDARQSARVHYADIAARLSGAGMEIVHERLFGSLSAEAAVMEGRGEALRAAGIASDTPVTYIQGHPPWGEGFAGAMLLAVNTSTPDSEVWTVMDGDVPRGRGWKNRGETFLYLQNLCGSAGTSRAEQTQSTIDQAQRLLRDQGASFGDVIRTWWYLNDILDWYDEFNQARSAKYEEIGIMPKDDGTKLLLPASTGIEGIASHRTAAAMDLVAAFGPPQNRPDIKQLSNVGQKDAYCYGSAFSRGAVICEPAAHVLQLSGTASIDELGATIHIDDPRAQIECTLDKIETLLGQEGARLGDVAAATVFVKHPAYSDLFWKIIAERGLDSFPAVCVVADVCRDDLLFEMDGEIIYTPQQ